jgi:putative tricarboxylic transport membrane protein
MQIARRAARGGGSAHRLRRTGAATLALALVLAACNGDADEPDVDDDTEDTVDDDADDADVEDDEADDEEADDEEAAETDWEPDGTITMVVPFAAGGGSDVLGRAVAEGLEEVRDVDVSVDNRTGGAGGVGYGYFLEQSGDPLYVLPAEVTRSVLPATQEVPFDWDTWTDVGMFFEDIGYVVVSEDSEWEDIESLIEDAQQAYEDGTPLTMGVPAAGGIDQVLVEGLAEENDFEWEIVAYDGTGETNPALQGGDIDGTIGNPSDTRQEIESGLFRPLLGFAEERLDDELFEDVPVSAELGWGLTATKYRGVILPPDVPEEAVDWYEAALRDWTETEGFDEYRENAALSENILWREEWVEFIEEWNEQVLPGLEPEE